MSKMKIQSKRHFNRKINDNIKASLALIELQSHINLIESTTITSVNKLISSNGDINNVNTQIDIRSSANQCIIM